MPGDPGAQVALALIAEFHQQGVLFQSLPELLFALVRPEIHIGQHQTAILRHVRQQPDQPLPLRFAALKEVYVLHQHQRALGHHGQRLQRVCQQVDGKILRVETVEVKILRQLVQQALFDPRQGVAPQIILLAEEHIKPPQVPGLQVAFQLCVGLAVPSGLLCHSSTS